MKKKKLTPFHAGFRMIMLSFFIILSLLTTLKYADGGKNESDKFFLICLFIMIASGIINAALGLYAIANKEKMKSGDEYTAKIINKAGSITFIAIMSIIAVLFLVVQVIGIANADNSLPLNEWLDVRIILCVVAGISLVGSSIYSLAILAFCKRGITDEL